LPSKIAVTRNGTRLVCVLLVVCVAVSTLFYFLWPTKPNNGAGAQFSAAELDWLQRDWGGSSWNGGKPWGEISFAPNGHEARFIADNGKGDGQIFLTGIHRTGAGFISLIGTWENENRENGQIILLLSKVSQHAELQWGTEDVQKQTLTTQTNIDN
jgi:hypothetical protein